MLDPCFCSAHTYIRFNLSISAASQFRQRSYKWRRRVKASPTAARWLPTATVAVGASCHGGAVCGGEGDRGPHPDFLFHLNFHHALLEAIGLQVSMPPLLFMPLHHFFCSYLLFVLLGNEEPGAEPGIPNERGQAVIWRGPKAN